ncbi:hypothetical protein F511_12391 [Dorcoceras hygrometricum]|uniref:Uncharacterized protein n=1 Tax=Dorcoceras hygrometricum TaxID=472368 RepID=A0A2Z7BJE0_9LAMI|nr:hypothetical protein F511_12391 [Dorcoceras hygrometricum]
MSFGLMDTTAFCLRAKDSADGLCVGNNQQIVGIRIASPGEAVEEQKNRCRETINTVKLQAMTFIGRLEFATLLATCVKHRLEPGTRASEYGPFNPYIPIRSTTIGKSRVAIDPIAMHKSWRSNSDITSVTSIGYPRMSASGESSTTMHRLLHASGSHPIPTPHDPKVSMTFRVVRTNQYNQDLGLIHSTNGNHLESPKEDSSIDHQVTIYLHAQNITMFPTNETCSVRMPRFYSRRAVRSLGARLRDKHMGRNRRMKI